MREREGERENCRVTVTKLKHFYSLSPCSVLRNVDFESKFRTLPRYNENQSPGAIASPRVFSSNYMKKPMIPTPLSANPIRCESRGESSRPCFI